jgi:hypothetical protein
MLWRGVASFGVVGPYFFEDQISAVATVTSSRHVQMFQIFVVPQIICLGRKCVELRWQQDGATTHTARASMEDLRPIFPSRVFFRNGNIAWPVISQERSAFDLFLWGYLKGKTWTRRPTMSTMCYSNEFRRRFQAFRTTCCSWWWLMLVREWRSS